MFYDKFKPNTLTIKDFQYWVVTLREKQVSLGASVIILKREVASVSEVMPEEMAEFPKVVAWFEKTCKEKFGAKKFNYLAMMMKDHYVHFHSYPRYSNNIMRYGVEFVDYGLPKPFNTETNIIDETIMQKILKDMQNL